jgi:hypothetical protein
MKGVMSTPLTILFELDAIGIILLVLFGRIVTTLAFGAGESDQSTHEFSFKFIVLSLLPMTKH